MDKKELIRKHAIDIFAERGYFGTTPKMIASKAEIAVGTIYLYFKSKEEILDHIFLTEFAKRKKFLDSINSRECTIKERLNLFLDFHFNELEENKSTGILLIQESGNPQQQKLAGVQKFLYDLPQIFAEMLLEAGKKQEIRDLNCQLVGNIIFYSIRGSVAQLKSNSQGKSYTDVKNELATFIWHAIK